MSNFKRFLKLFEANDTEVLKDINPDSPGGNLVNNAYHAIKQKNATAAQDFVNKAKQFKDMAGLDKLKKDYYSRYGAKDIDNIYEAGYDYGKGMSNNTVSAYKKGEKPKSKWTREEILKGVSALFDNPTAYDKREYGDFISRKDEVMGIVRKLPLARLKEVLLIKSSWHHTSKYYNATDFYSLPSDISELYDALYQNDLFEKKVVWEEVINKARLLESILPELKKMDRICQIDSRYSDTYLYLGLKGEEYGIYADKKVKKFNGYAWDYSLISPAFTSKEEALEWAKGYLTRKATLEDVKEMYQEGIFKVFDNDFKQVLNLEGEGGKHTISIWPKSGSKGIDPLPKYMIMGNGPARNVERINYIKATGRPSEYEN